MKHSHGERPSETVGSDLISPEDAPSVYPLAEYRRPWKLATFALGLGLLFAGSYLTPAPDLDVPISIIMATITYLTAPWSMRVLLERRWRLWLLMLFATWFAVDGCYALYWGIRDPAVLDGMRAGNWPASLALYGMCGVVWLYRGTLADLWAELVRLRARHKG